MDVFASRLTRVGCPSYLVPTRAETLHSTEFRRTLLLWLFAVLHNPNVRDSVAQVWAKDEPTNKELERWLLLHTGETRETCQDLMEGKLPVKWLLALLGRIVDSLEGRMMIENSSESMKEVFEMVVDIGTHEQQFFDPICTLFPPSVKVLLSQENPPENSQLEKEIGFLKKRAELLEARMQSLNGMGLSIALDVPQSDEQSSQAKSQQLGSELEALVHALKAGDDVISDKIACWTHFSRLQDVGMASAASEAHEKLQELDQIMDSLTHFSAFEKEVAHIKQVRTICDHGRALYTIVVKQASPADLKPLSDENESLNDNTHITIRGIQNLGNTCYFNAILQALAASRSFQMYLDELVTSASCRLPAVTAALHRCMQELKPGKEKAPKPLIPSELNRQLALRIGNFGRRKQQDCQEILHLLLHLIQKEQATESYPDRGLRDIAAFLRGSSLVTGELSSFRGSTGYASLLPASFSLEGSISYEQFRQSVETCERWMPLCGLEGNFLQCTSCKLKRPVSNHRFTSISLALGTSSKVEKITLDACLRYYTREELISDVECVCCSIQQAIQCTRLQYASLTTQLEAESRWDSNTAKPHSMEVEIKVHACRNRIHTLHQLLESSNLHQIDLQDVITPAERIVSNCTKSMRFTRCPETFCFHFNRKVYFDWSGTTSKLDTHVIFPIEIDMRPFCFFGEPNLPENFSVDRAHYLYEIVAVISHHGDEHSGHYIAYRRVKISDAHTHQWFWVSDDVVHQVEFDQVRASRAYLLFYERKESESTRLNGKYGSSRSSLRKAGSFAWSRKGISGSQMDHLETVEATDFEMTVERDLKLRARPDNLDWAR